MRGSDASFLTRTVAGYFASNVFADDSRGQGASESDSLLPTADAGQRLHWLSWTLSWSGMVRTSCATEHAPLA